jgi:hypothetical protein
LGKIVPNGWLFTLGSLKKLQKQLKILDLFYRLRIGFDKKWLGYILAIFTNSTGRPGSAQCIGAFNGQKVLLTFFQSGDENCRP